MRAAHPQATVTSCLYIHLFAVGAVHGRCYPGKSFFGSDVLVETKVKGLTPEVQENQAYSAAVSTWAGLEKNPA